LTARRPSPTGRHRSVLLSRTSSTD
jgi:hypothetical protein